MSKTTKKLNKITAKNDLQDNAIAESLERDRLQDEAIK